MLPLLTALAVLATLTAVHCQTLRFDFAEPPLRSRATAQPLSCTPRARYTCIR